MIWLSDSDAPCERNFERWAREDPHRLVAHLASDDPQHLMTFAAEVAGRDLPTDLVKGPLLALLDDSRAVVREGAVLGLGNHMSDPDVRSRLVVLSTSDSSPGVREVASGIVEDEP